MKTYADLRTFITTLLERDDLTVLLPQFIAMFESDLQSELSVADTLVEASTLTLTAGTSVVTLPGMHTIRSVSYKGELLTPYAGLVPDEVTGQPILYGAEGNEAVRFYPTPDQTYTLDVLYVPIISPLLMGGTIDDTAESWILKKWPNVYTYGVLAVIYTYLNDDAKAVKFAQLYNTALFRMLRVQPTGTPIAVNDLPM